MLVCLAATVAMIQANLLLDTFDETPASYVRMDVMRLALGVLSGIGFIGAGAIVRRGALMLGVTTAATMWFVTVMGLCFGGGQLGLGSAAFAVAMGVLWALKWIDRRIRRERHSKLTVVMEAAGPADAEIRAALIGAGFRIGSEAIWWQADAGRRTLTWDIHRAEEIEHRPPTELLARLAAAASVVEVRWEPAAVED
jgi:putative Mg2+ transporter-C (MgtC) family protein